MAEILKFHAKCTVSKRIKDLKNHKLHKLCLLIIRSCIPDKISFIKMSQNTCRIPFLKKMLKIPLDELDDKEYMLKQKPDHQQRTEACVT